LRLLNRSWRGGGLGWRALRLFGKGPTRLLGSGLLVEYGARLALGQAGDLLAGRDFQHRADLQEIDIAVDEGTRVLLGRGGRGR